MRFSGYPHYKKSDIAWVGSVPKHWRNVPFFSLLRERSESNKGLKNSNLLSLSYGRIIQKDINTLDGLLPVSFETYQVVYPKDIVFRLTDLQNDKRSLRSAIVREKGIITSAYLCVECININPRFASYLFRAYDLLKVFYSMGGGLRQSMKFTDMKWLPILLPSPEEQTQIARFLDHETARIDALIEEQRRLIELLKEKRQAVTSHAVTKGLDPNVPMKDSGVEWLGEVPAHWSVSRMKYHSTRIGDGLHATPVYDDDGDYYFVNGNNLSEGKVLFGSGTRKVSRQEYLKHRVNLNDNTVLLSINGTIGNLALYRDEKVILGKSAAYINTDEGLGREYLMLFMSSSAIRGFFEYELTGTTISNLSLRSIAEMPILIPPYSEQKEVVGALSETISEFNALIDNAQALSSLLKERRSALISAAVTGKIDVRNWQPDQSSTADTGEDYAMVAEQSAEYQ